jgi:molybdopterin-guanine dinucleotide biosynthesis protein A
MSAPRGGLAALVLAAGEGRRLRPLTTLRPKPLCPVGETTLLDLALARVATVVRPEATAVNAHHLAAQVVAAVGNRAHLSVEQPEALGTAGAVGALRAWLDGRDVLITNADVCFDAEPDLRELVAGWDRTRPRLLVVRDPARADFDGGLRFAGVSLLPAATAAALQPVPSGLYEVVWRHAELDLVETAARYVDCADPPSYLAANLMRSGGPSVIGAGAVVEGAVERCVVWPGATVHRGEHLVDVIRARGDDWRDVTVSGAP